MAKEESDSKPPKDPPSPKDPPMTSQEFVDGLDDLVSEAKAAGLQPLQLIARTYLRQGAAWLDGVLGAVEEGNPKGKKK